ncbi:MAG: helix-turn-helix domain-containing protein [Pseudonocardiaceae bacterium]
MAQIPRELTPYVSVRHFFGAELRWWRLAAGLSHDRLGAQVNYSGDLIGKVEKAERMPTAALAQACDEALGTDGALARLVGLVGLVEATTQQEPARRVAPASERPVCGWLLAGQAPTVKEASARGAGPVNRFEFLVSTFGVGAGSLVDSMAPAEASRLGQGDVVSWKRTLNRLYGLDAQYGGGGVYDLALQSIRQLRRVLYRASYGPSTGEALHTIAGELRRYAGWLAFDAGHQAEARYCWLEASHTARLVGDDRLFVATLKSLSRQATELGRPQEGLDLAQAALQAARPWATPRLRSHLLSLEASAYSRLGDKQATWHARNRASYLVYRAEVLVQQRNIEEAVSTAALAVEGAREVSSARIDARIGRVRTELARYSDQPRVAEFLDWSGQIMATKANRSTLTT